MTNLCPKMVNNNAGGPVGNDPCMNEYFHMSQLLLKIFNIYTYMYLFIIYKSKNKLYAKQKRKKRQTCQLRQPNQKQRYKRVFMCQGMYVVRCMHQLKLNSYPVNCEIVHLQTFNFIYKESGCYFSNDLVLHKDCDL